MNRIVFFIFISMFSHSILAHSDSVMREASKPSALINNLRLLSDEIGGRVTGTPALEKAVQWSAQAFHAAGADAVTIEPYTIQMGWHEGDTRVEVASPVKFSIQAKSFGWSPAFVTSKPLKIIDIGEGSKNDFSRVGDLQNAIVLLHTRPMHHFNDLDKEYLDLPPVIERALAKHAAAIAVMSTRPHNLMYRHIHASTEKVDVIPILQFAREDAERIARLLQKNAPVTISISMPNQFTPAFTAWNVIGELKGSEKPQEWVLLGAHLDSWDLGTGALDNGCNVALVIDTLRAIKASGIKPRRSIRFALFTGEEEGFLGSQAYVKQHHAEMKDSAGVVIFDTGSGAVTGYSLAGRKDIANTINGLTQPLKSHGVKTQTLDAGVWTDNLSFLFEGLPNLTANQTTSNYLENYHAESDTFDKVDLQQLRKNVVIATGTIFAMANMKERMPQLNVAETTALLKSTALDAELKLLDVWDLWIAIKALREKQS